MGAPILRAWNQIACAAAAIRWGDEALAARLLDAATTVGDEQGAPGVSKAADRVPRRSDRRCDAPPFEHRFVNRARRHGVADLGG